MESDDEPLDDDDGYRPEYEAPTDPHPSESFNRMTENEQRYNR